MRKATFVMATLSFVTSATTLGVVLHGAKKVHDDIQEVREKSNQAISKLQAALIDFSV